MNPHSELGVVKDEACEQNTLKNTDAYRSTYQGHVNKSSLQLLEVHTIAEQSNNPQIVDEDLLQGLCPEDLLNCSTPFCTSMHDTSMGHLKQGETILTKMKAPTVQVSPNLPSVSNSMSFPSNPIYSTPKPSPHRQFTVNIPPDILECAALPESPTSRKFEPTDFIPDQYSFPSDTFYGLPLKVKKCVEEYRGITTLYGE